ncbi:hypothetical protein [uncultured Exiguobacterium sp.]|uniref:hypothetical protein n=1 Tax=uncultured Exiguobacterium sp. TaxID=202669 RepID=UPI0025DBD6F2|nr:hypothetical protein [uncultured Exiguobacterium sp.]
MIQQFIEEQQSHATIGGFIAKSADPILAHVNPSRLQDNDLILLIQADQSIVVSNGLDISTTWVAPSIEKSTGT